MDTTETTNTVAIDRDKVAAEITSQLLEALNSRKAQVSLTDRILQYASDKIADAGNGVAELSAGFSAAADNFRVHRESAKLRQRTRTAEKIAQLVEQQLAMKGL